MKALKMKNPPHPGFSVRVDCLEPHGLSVTEGAKMLGVSRSALSHLVNQNADLSWDMAIRLAKAFGSTPEGWMLDFKMSVHDTSIMKSSVSAS